MMWLRSILGTLSAPPQPPNCWAFFIFIKRSIPRWAIFPTLFVILILVRVEGILKMVSGGHSCASDLQQVRRYAL